MSETKSVKLIPRLKGVNPVILLECNTRIEDAEADIFVLFAHMIGDQNKTYNVVIKPYYHEKLLTDIDIPEEYKTKEIQDVPEEYKTTLLYLSLELKEEGVTDGK